jgi:CRP/FNR family transcriptional regulator
MELSSCFPIWNKLSEKDQNRILQAADTLKVKKDTMLHDSSVDCLGLLVIKSGQLRVYILSEEGREITIYRLFDRDVCLLSASCKCRSQYNHPVLCPDGTEYRYFICRSSSCITSFAG